MVDKPEVMKGHDKKSKQQRMLIGIGIVSLILTFLLLRRASANDATNAANAANANTDSNLNAYEQTNAADLANLAAQLQTLQSQVGGQSPTLGSGDGQPGTPAGNPPSGNPAPTPGPAPTPAPGPPPTPPKVPHPIFNNHDPINLPNMTPGTGPGGQSKILLKR